MCGTVYCLDYMKKIVQLPEDYKGRWSKRLMLLIVCCVFVPTFVLFGLVAEMQTARIRYCLWKRGIGEYNPIYLRNFDFDDALRTSMLGQDINRLKTIFPECQPTSFETWMSVQLPNNNNEHVDFYKIGNSGWVVEVSNDRIVRFHMLGRG